ncbi:MAG: fasciclin domain-containing protein, partial [Pseudomonadota bacterium]
RRLSLTAIFAIIAVHAFTFAPAQAHHTNNIVKTAAKAGQFKTLIAAAKAAGLAGVLSRKHNLTVFAPTDAAFARLGKKTLRSLLKPRNRHKLRRILLYHVLGQRVPAGKIAPGRSRVKTLAGKRVTLRKSRKGVRVNRARVIAPNVRASNGIIHVINRVLIP